MGKTDLPKTFYLTVAGIFRWIRQHRLPPSRHNRKHREWSRRAEKWGRQTPILDSRARGQGVGGPVGRKQGFQVLSQSRRKIQEGGQGVCAKERPGGCLHSVRPSSHLGSRETAQPPRILHHAQRQPTAQPGCGVYAVEHAAMRKLKSLQNGQDILDNLADLKVTLVDRYDKWVQKHPDGADLEQTPNIRTQKIASDDAAARAQQQRERFQEEERARNDARAQQRIAAEELAKWKQLSDQKRAQDEAERARRKDAAVAAARQAGNSLPPRPYYTFSRPPNAVVLSEGQPSNDNVRQQQQQQQAQTRLREEDITRHQAEQKRKQEQEGIARRQKEADEAAPSSSFYQQAPIDYPQAQPLRNNYSDAPEKFERPATAMFNGTQTISGGTFVLNVISSDRRT
jgi:hypothetical protein